MTQQKKPPVCPGGLMSIGGKCKLEILSHLLSGTKRFNELQRLLPWTSRQTLTVHLRELEQRGMLRRQVYAQVPPKVEYSLTEQGRAVEPLLRHLQALRGVSHGNLCSE